MLRFMKEVFIVENDHRLPTQYTLAQLVTFNKQLIIETSTLYFKLRQFRPRIHGANRSHYNWKFNS